MKRVFFIVLLTMMIGAASAQRGENERMLDRFVAYASIGSQSKDTVDQSVFLLTDGQRNIASYIFDEIKQIRGVEVWMSEDYYVYARVPSNMKKVVPSVGFMAHLDCSFEASGSNDSLQVRPQVHRNYDGGDIVLSEEVVLSPDSPQGAHLKDLVGKTIVTSDGTTLLGADCKAGCAILVTLIERLTCDRRLKHGDVWFVFAQNEETGRVQMRMDERVREIDILIDVDGNVYGEFSVANFTAVNCSYLFTGNLAHSSNGKVYGYADARTAMAYFIGQLPPEIHHSNSEGSQGYVHCYSLEQLDNKSDYRIMFRIRYFDKADSVVYASYLEEALRRTREAYPRVSIDLENMFCQYDNVANNMHPEAVLVIERAARRMGMSMRPASLRAGTTCALMVAHGLPGGPCIYGGQQAVHSVLEWCCVEELVELTDLCNNIVVEVSSL